MDPVAIAGLLKDYGPLAFAALCLYGIKTVTGWWRDCMKERLEDHKAMTERMATALERQGSTNADIAENLKEMREGQLEILKVTTESAFTTAATSKEIAGKLGEIAIAQRKPTGGAR